MFTPSKAMVIYWTVRNAQSTVIVSYRCFHWVTSISLVSYRDQRDSFIEGNTASYKATKGGVISDHLLDFLFKFCLLSVVVVVVAIVVATLSHTFFSAEAWYKWQPSKGERSSN